MASITRTRQKNRDQRRDEVRSQLLRAVEEVTAGGESFTNVSVERLATAAGISRATFYIYFADKGDLLQAWVEQTVGELVEAANAWFALDASAAKDDLRAALAGVVAVYRPRAALMAAVYDEATYDAEIRAQVTALVTRGIKGIERHIKKGQAGGWIDPDLLPAETAAWLGWMVERGLNDVIGPAPDSELDALIDAHTDIVWYTLYADAPGRN